MKYCSICRQGTSDDAEVCSSCGNSTFDDEIEAHQMIDNQNESITKYNKIGGWLILIALGRIVGIIYLPVTLQTYLSLSNEISWQIKLMVQVNLVYAIVIFVLNILLLILMFKRKKAFPYVMIGYLFLALVFYIAKYNIYHFYNILNQQPEKNVMYSLVSCIIWIPYFLKSVRVEKTFIK